MQLNYFFSLHTNRMNPLSRMEKAFQLIYNDRHDHPDPDLIELDHQMDSFDMATIRDALTNYMESGYIQINAELFSGTPSPWVKQQTESILQAMALFRPFRSMEPLTVYRGVYGISDQEYAPLILSQLRTKKYMNRSYFTSTSLTKKKALAYTECCLLEIQLDPIQTLDYIWLSAKNEDEILIEPNTHLICTHESSLSYEGRTIPVFHCTIGQGYVVPKSTLYNYHDLPPLLDGKRRRSSRNRRKRRS